MSYRPSRRHSTRTVTENGRLVPSLAASGPLAYTPEDPPSSDYHFQYSWILPEIFVPAVNRRRHFYFGAQRRDDSRELFSFGESAREGRTNRVARQLGRTDALGIATPLAAYSVRDHLGRDLCLFVQHGSYQWVPVEEQPLLDSGDVILYRGVHESDVFRFLQVDRHNLDQEKRDVWQKYIKTQGQMLSDSILSFNTIHDRTKRCETSHILDGTWIGDEIAKANDLDIAGDGFAAELWQAAHIVAAFFMGMRFS